MAPTHRPIGFVITDTGCWECTSHCRGSSGYPMTSIGGRSIGMNRYVYMKYVGPIPDGLCVRHSCDNRSCINPDHLLTGTWADNNRDSVMRGRNSRGEGRPASKLDEKQVIAIRAESGKSIRTIAKEYGVSYSTVRYIRAGLTWKYLLLKDQP